MRTHQQLREMVAKGRLKEIQAAAKQALQAWISADDGHGADASTAVDLAKAWCEQKL